MHAALSCGMLLQHTAAALLLQRSLHGVAAVRHCSLFCARCIPTGSVLPIHWMCLGCRTETHEVGLGVSWAWFTFSKGVYDCGLLGWAVPWAHLFNMLRERVVALHTWQNGNACIFCRCPAFVLWHLARSLHCLAFCCRPCMLLLPVLACCLCVGLH